MAVKKVVVEGLTAPMLTMLFDALGNAYGGVAPCGADRRTEAALIARGLAEPRTGTTERRVRGQYHPTTVYDAYLGAVLTAKGIETARRLIVTELAALLPGRLATLTVDGQQRTGRIDRADVRGGHAAEQWGVWVSIVLPASEGSGTVYRILPEFAPVLPAALARSRDDRRIDYLTRITRKWIGDTHA